LNGLHERCGVLSEASEKQYISLKDKIENIIKAVEAKEDEIYGELIDDFGVKGIYDNQNQGMFDVEGLLILDNIKLLNSAIEYSEDAESLKDYQKQLVALLGVKV
jgi:hypothetical protein